MTFDHADEDTRRRVIEEASHAYRLRPSTPDISEMTTEQSQQMGLPSPDAIDEAAGMIFEVLQLNAGAKQSELQKYCLAHGINDELRQKAFTRLDRQLDVITETIAMRGDGRLWQVKVKERKTTRTQIVKRAQRFRSRAKNSLT